LWSCWSFRDFSRSLQIASVNVRKVIIAFLRLIFVTLQEWYWCNSFLYFSSILIIYIFCFINCQCNASMDMEAITHSIWLSENKENANVEFFHSPLLTYSIYRTICKSLFQHQNHFIDMTSILKIMMCWALL